MTTHKIFCGKNEKTVYILSHTRVLSKAIAYKLQFDIGVLTLYVIAYTYFL